jgi:hypothetical protein
MALTDIMSMFRRGPTDQSTQLPAPQPATNVADNPTVPSSNTPTSDGTKAAFPEIKSGEASPLANFDTLWQNDTTKEADVPPSLAPKFNLDHAGIMSAAQKIDFTSHIAPDLVAKAMSGDAAAFLAVINQAGQLGFANATIASGTLVQNSLSNAQQVLHTNVLPAALREQAVHAAINASNPIFSDPSVAPMLDMLKTRLAATYPHAPPQEIAATAVRYLNSMSQKLVSSTGGTIVSGNQTTQQGFRPAKEENWASFFNN